MMEETGIIKYPNGRYGAYFMGIPLYTHETEQDAWQDILDNGLTAWKNNNYRHESWIKFRADKPRPKIGQIISGFLVTDRRFSRDGNFGSGRIEFYVIAMQPKIERYANEGWVSEKCLQDHI